MAKRIQRKRTKGWKMPTNTIYVGRPSKWGNPFKVGDRIPDMDNGHGKVDLTTPDQVIYHYEKWITYGIHKPDVSELKGKNLACWCKEGEPCHADILLKLANE